MDDQDRAEILDEILRERMRAVRSILDEWSVPEADALTYAQAKDLIWQIAAPFGLAMLGFRVAEQALSDDPGNLDLMQSLRRCSRTGDDAGQLLERLLQTAARVRS
jgi:hypothetical protein